ncbi:T9SS type A sorting domain-containing protein [bacterium]|nr:MAG: T9SS type A sorting domain-containing protein [bacterium]
MRLYLVLVAILMGGLKAQAQERHLFPKPIQAIVDDFESNSISRSQALLSIQKVLTGNELTVPIKCASPLLQILKASGEDLTTSSILKSQPQTASFYTSPSGKFKFEYYTTGSDSVWTIDVADSIGIPDYVERAAIEMDKIWTFQVSQLGFRDPLAGINPYPIAFKKSIYYGLTESTGKRIVINSTFNGFPKNDDPEGDVIGALKVTLAHEFKHAIQYRYNGFSGDSHNWAEMDATLLEEVNYDEVNDYYYYLKDEKGGSLFVNPELSVIPGSYYDVTFALYFHEVFGETFWTDVWNRIGSTQPNFLLALDAQLQEEGTSLEEEYPKLVKWHFFTGFRSKAGFGFDEAENYPTAKRNANLLGSMTQFTDSYSLNRLAFKIITISKGTASGYVNLAVQGTGTKSDGFIWHKSDIANEVFDFSIESESFNVNKTDKQWSQTDTMFVVLIGSSDNGDASAKIMNISDSNPSLFPWGDIDLSGELNTTDISTIIEDNLTTYQQPELNNWVSDITRDGTVSGLDASLILRVLNGVDANFYIDDNQDGLMPEPNLFRTNVNHFISPEADSIIVLIKPLDAKTVDARLEVNLDYSTEELANSILLTMPIDTLNLSLMKVELDSFLSQAQMDYTLDGNELKIMIVNTAPIPSGAILTLSFNRKTAVTSAQFSFSSVKVDEYETFYLRSPVLNTELPTRVGVSNTDETKDTATPESFELYPAYPNPFNPSTTLSFTLPKSGNVSISIFNYLGQLVHQQQLNQLSAGMHRVKWDASILSSGIYLIQIQSNNQRYVQKVSLVK